jgi:hypothetical protein
VIDGASTDDTLEILRRYASQVTWISEPDKGQADALNKGFQRAQGDIIGWLNADDTYQPQAIPGAVRYLQANPEAALVYGNFNFIDETGRVIYTHCTPRFSVEKLLYGNVIPNAGMFVRRWVIEAIGGPRSDLHYVLDWEFVLRLALRYRVYQAPAVWGNFRMTPGTKSVEKSDCFWPEIIPILDEVTAAASGPLNTRRPPALFWAHLFGAVEYARTGRLEAAQDYLAQALNWHRPALEEVSGLARAIIETASHPWHRGFRDDSNAQQTIFRLACCLGNSAIEQALRAYLDLYRGLAEIKHGDRTNGRALLAESWPVIPKRGLIRFPMLKLLLNLILGTRLSLKVRSLRNRLVISWRSYHP